MKPFGAVTHIEHAGIGGLILYFAGENLGDANQQVSHFVSALMAQKPSWLVEAVPSFDNLLVCFDIDITDYHDVYHELARIQVSPSTKKAVSEHVINVWYGSKNANDLRLVAFYTGLSVSDIVELHSEKSYEVYAVGFAPGFAYMGELDERLSMPRMTTPRPKVPAGAVAIADRQTAVYPSMSPGGWHLLGLSPDTMFCGQDKQSRFSVGDKVRFNEIDELTFNKILVDTCVS